MNSRAIEHPALSFATSIGAVALQAVSWPLLFLVGVAHHRDMPIAIQVAMAIWFFLPLVSIVGLVSAIARLRKKQDVILSSVGLGLNACYLALFTLIAYGTFTGRLSV
jgi:hypothetical protein